MAVYGYTRVSTRIQAEDGLSLESQGRQIHGYAMMQGLEIDGMFVEKAVSGWKPITERLQGERLVASVSAGDTIICAKLDRMFRSARDALVVSDELKKRGVSLHLIDLGGDVTGNGISKMFFTIIAAFAEFERDRIAERIADVKSDQREKGRYLGGARPFGYQVNDVGDLVPIEDEQLIIERVAQLRLEGKSLRAIADEVSTSEKKVSHVTVKRILRDVGQ